MTSQEFAAYKARYKKAIVQVLSASEGGRLDEAAFPAYSHRNPLINWLFWQRLRKTMEFMETPARYARVLDFGCGSGVMLPFLSQRSDQVVATDVDLMPISLVQAHIPLSKNVELVDALKIPVSELGKGSFDRVVALDVLEHVHDLPQTLNELLALLRPGGQLIVSGPTENALYRLGRKLAGPEYSGAYHERGIAEIKTQLLKSTTIRPIAVLYQPLPLFEVFSAVKS